jgi:pyruvate formate lyase activating enzyme
VGPFENTYCPSCQALLIERVGYTIRTDLVTPAVGACPACRTRIAGVWG